MKKIILIFIVLIVGVIWIFKATECRLESRKVQKVARPIVEAFVEHIDKDGVPKSLDDVQGIKHKLISCKGNKKVEGCNGYEDRRYFEYGDGEYSIFIEGGSSAVERRVYFEIVHNDTLCSYYVYKQDLTTKKGEVPLSFSRSRCRKRCGTTWWRQ